MFFYDDKFKWQNTIEELLKQYGKHNHENINKKLEDGCPKCGHPGEFIRMALCCPEHGVFGGC